MRYQICKKGVIRVVGIKIPLTEKHEDNMVKILLFCNRPLEPSNSGKSAGWPNRSLTAFWVSAPISTHSTFSITLLPPQISPSPMVWKNF